MAKEPVWLRLSELENAIDSLEMVSYFLANVKSQTKWKWSSIALHQALYGFAISASSGFVKKKVTKLSKRYPEGKLISIWDAINLTKEPADAAFEFYDLLVLSSDEELAIKKLVDDFRNELEHFTPKIWSLEVSDMPKIFTRVVRVIRFIALESRRVNSSVTDEQRIGAAIEKIELLLDNQ
jgi:hypothetical protein